MRKIPMRKCVATQEQLPKKDLLRIVKTSEGEVKVDITGKLNGRGAYLKKDETALLLAKKKGVLERNLETPISDAIYEEILKIIHEQ
ncbi:MAG: RNase P modulator RnpM [Anaerorhabdus sp.]